MDVPVPPAIVMESRAVCSDAGRAKELLQRTLAPALAPRSNWTVFARFSRKGSSLVVEGEITDEVDSPVAHRVLTEASSECASLARAVGVWASLVLDSEVDRAATPPEAPPPPPPTPAPPAERLERPPETSLILGGPDPENAVELGLTMSIMGGEGSGAMAGPTLYGVVETGRGWFLRPSVFVVRTLEELATSSDVYGTLIATRFDTCRRVSGFHIKRLTLDLCGGAELGFMHFDQPSAQPGAPAMTMNSTLPFLALGPSLALRGELGGGLALVLRGVADLNVVLEGYSETGATPLSVTPSLFIGRGEVGLSWQLR